MFDRRRIQFLCLFVVFAIVESANNGSTTSSHTADSSTKPATKVPTSTQPHITTTLTPEQECAARNSSCDNCLKLAKCMYCKTNKACIPYPVGKVLPPSSVCKLDEARWGVCWVNFEALIIAMGVIGGIILLSITVCICCCCCKKDNSQKYAKEDAKWERKKAERKEKADERKAERKARTDEIRRKYGLIKEDNPYERFENA